MAYFNRGYVLESLLSKKSKNEQKTGNHKTGYYTASENEVSRNGYKIGSKIFNLEEFEIYNSIQDSIQICAEANYQAHFKGNTYEMSEKHFKSASKQNVHVFKIGASLYKSGNDGTPLYTAKIIKEEFTGTLIEALNKYGFSSTVNDDSNEEKLRKQEVKAVMSICNAELKELKSKYKSEFNISITFHADKDMISFFSEDIHEKDIQIGSGELRSSSSTAENSKQISIYNELFKNINNKIKNDPSIRGKVTDDWGKTDCMLFYSY